MMEFFEDDKERLSMAAAVLFGSFVVTAIIMLTLTFQDKMSEGYLTIFLTAFVANMAIKRTADFKTAQVAPPEKTT